MGIIPTIMYGTLILYKLPKKISHNNANQFCKKLYGQNTSSHKGRYEYHIRGLLDEIPHHRLIRGAFIIRNQDVEKVIAFLKNYSVDVYTRTIKLTKEDIKSLEMSLK